MKYVYLFGACGSIGTQTLDVVRQYPDEFKIVGLTLGHDFYQGEKIIEEFKPEIVCYRNKENMDKSSFNGLKCYGDDGLIQVAKFTKYKNELLVNALVGSAGLLPTAYGIKARKNIALANKETLVMAGEQIKALIKEYEVELYPIDSEHSAIWQCLAGENKDEVKSLIITASGGSFRDKKREELINVTKEDALKHPNWSMGAKITIDSATMMNKGFEVIEAHYLFDIEPSKIKTILHRESIIHSMVEYNDNGVKALMSEPDMRGPILYALLYPKHLPYNGKELDLIKLHTLHFEELSTKRFRCLGFAYDAINKKGLYPAVLNAANEAAVRLFLNDKIKFLEIEDIIEKEISKEYFNFNPTIEDILSINKEVYNRIIKEYGGENI